MGRRTEYLPKLSDIPQTHKKFMYNDYALIQEMNDQNQLNL